MFNPRNYRLVFEFLLELDAFVKAVKEEDFGAAAMIAEDQLFTQGSALYGEGFGPLFAHELRRLGCDELVEKNCPVIVSAFFRAMAVFASVGKDGELKSEDPQSSTDQ